MGTIADKLAYTMQARNEIRSAIVRKGVNCPGDAPFCTFDTYIDKIEGSGQSNYYITDNLKLLVDARNPITVLYGDSLNNRQLIASNVLYENNALKFNGSNSWINCGRLDLTASLTLEVLVKFDRVGTEAESNAVAGNWQSGGYGIQQASKKYSGNLYINNAWCLLYGDNVNVNEVVHLAITYDGETACFYQNGTLVDYANISGSVVPPASSTVFSIGSNPKGDSIGITPLMGNVYAVRLYSSALTAEEIISNYSTDKINFVL